MEEHFGNYLSGTADATQHASPAPPKSNEDRIVDALEMIASEIRHLRQQLESLTDGGGYSDGPAAIRTTGR